MTSPAVITAVVSEGTLIRGDPGARPVPWWSFAKTVIAAAALVLVRDGELVLDEPVAGKRYTLRQLLAHTAGVPNYSDLDDYTQCVARRAEPWPVEEMLDRVQADRLLFEPGRDWRYSNTGYLLMRRIIEAVAGDDLLQALQQLVLLPLGIEGVSMASYPTELEATEWGNPDGYPPGWVYHGLLIGPPASAALLLERLLAGRVLPADLLAQMGDRRPLGGELSGRPWKDFGYGLGTMIALDGPAGPSIGHTGSGPISVAAVYRFSDHRKTVAAFSSIADQAVVEWAAHEAAIR